MRRQRTVRPTEDAAAYARVVLSPPWQRRFVRRARALISGILTRTAGGVTRILPNRFRLRSRVAYGRKQMPCRGISLRDRNAQLATISARSRRRRVDRRAFLW